MGRIGSFIVMIGVIFLLIQIGWVGYSDVSLKSQDTLVQDLMVAFVLAVVEYFATLIIMVPIVLVGAILAALLGSDGSGCGSVLAVILIVVGLVALFAVGPYWIFTVAIGATNSILGWNVQMLTAKWFLVNVLLLVPSLLAGSTNTSSKKS